jgi:hypothetical protein
MKSLLWGREGRGEARGPALGVSPVRETGEWPPAPFDLLEGTSESTRAKTAETFLELLNRIALCETFQTPS